MVMTRLVAILLIVGAFSAVSSAPPASSSHAACTPRPTTVRGHPAVIECGPASAVVRFAGKTITYRGGTCAQQGPALSLYIGTHVTGAGSDHLFYLYLPHRTARSYTQATALVGIQLGYASYHMQTGVLKVTPGVTSGTFTGTLVTFPATKPAGTFSGSFTC